MKVAILSDIHGNLVALNQCLEAVKKIEAQAIVFLGDAVGYFPDGDEVVETLRKSQADCLKGNHDAMVLGEIKTTAELQKVIDPEGSSAVLSDENKEFLKSLHSAERSLIDGLGILFTHGSPADPLQGYVYPDADLSSFDTDTFDLVFMGHTHHSFIKRTANCIFVNVGSVGLPRDYGNWMSFGLLDTESRTVEVIREQLNVRIIKDTYGKRVHKSVLDVINRRCNTSPVTIRQDV